MHSDRRIWDLMQRIWEIQQQIPPTCQKIIFGHKNVVKCYERIDTLCNGFSLPLNLIVDCSRLIELLESTFKPYSSAPDTLPGKHAGLPDLLR